MAKHMVELLSNQEDYALDKENVKFGIVKLISFLFFSFFLSI